VHLGLEEGRVVGCLIEKQLTTPQQYPLTLNALVLACNQSSNRDPVVSYEARTVEQALVSLKDAGLIHFVHPSHGRSVTRYRQALSEWLGLDEQRSALAAVLLLRGPQTTGELRARTERMATFDGIGAVEAELEAMSDGPQPLVLRLPRRPGQKEERWTQLFAASEFGRTESSLEAAGGMAAAPPDHFDATVDPAWSLATRAGADLPTGDGRILESTDEQLAAVMKDVAGLRSEVAALRALVEQLRAQALPEVAATE
jgi:uncharacterized protein YceH (UPF0502 family)